MADSTEMASRVDKGLDYEQEALNGIRRSWELDDKECQALALADAQVWATLHLARITDRSNLMAVRELVWKQAKDRDLWLAPDAAFARVAKLQQALRDLHFIIESTLGPV